MKDTLKVITNLARLQIKQQQAVERCEQALSDAKEALRKTQQEDLPLAMAQADLSDVTLSDGKRLVVKQVVYASIPKDKVDQAYAWLTDHDFGDIIKGEVKVNFGRGQEEVASHLYQSLEKKGLHPIINRSVHPSTLKAWAREQLEAGANIPFELFGVHEVTQVDIK